MYAHLSAADIGLSVTPEHYADLIAIGRVVKWALNETSFARHPSDDRLSGIYGTILFDDLGTHEGNPHQHNVTDFADGEVDRSPCGSGTGSRVAVLASSGELKTGQTLIHDSLIGTRFHARIVDELEVGGHSAVSPEVSGIAFRTGQHTFTVDPADELATGFVLR
jgi:proline racemase